MAEICITDINGATYMQFLRLEDGTYYGGLTYHALAGNWKGIAPDFGVPGPHVRYHVGGLLELIGRIAREHGDPQTAFSLRSGYEYLTIAREMRADQLARALHCEEDEVHEHFDRLVTLTGDSRG